jgi:hypothetical protein
VTRSCPEQWADGGEVHGFESAQMVTHAPAPSQTCPPPSAHAVDCAAAAVPHTPAVHVRMRQVVPVPGHSAGDVHPPGPGVEPPPHALARSATEIAAIDAAVLIIDRR